VGGLQDKGLQRRGSNKETGSTEVWTRNWPCTLTPRLREITDTGCSAETLKDCKCLRGNLAQPGLAPPFPSVLLLGLRT